MCLLQKPLIRRIDSQESTQVHYFVSSLRIHKERSQYTQINWLFYYIRSVQLPDSALSFSLSLKPTNV